MRNTVITTMAFAFAAIAGCAQLSADQRELARVHWLSGVKEIIKSNDLSDYRNVEVQLNLPMEAKSPVLAKDVDGKVIGKNIDVDTVPSSDLNNKYEITFHYGVHIPNDQSYRRAILVVRNLRLSECITESEIYSAFGWIKRTTYAHSPNYGINYPFEGRNSIDLIFRFETTDSRCAIEIDMFQNRWK